MISAILLLLGSAFLLLSSLGLLRLRDPLERMHALAKAGTMGAFLILTALWLRFPGVAELIYVVASLMMIALATPVAAQVLAQNWSRRSTTRQDSEESQRE